MGIDEMLPSEHIIRLYKPERVLAAFKPEQRLAGLPPEQVLLALSDDALRQFPDSYLRTLSASTQEALRMRIGRPPQG